MLNTTKEPHQALVSDGLCALLSVRFVSATASRSASVLSVFRSAEHSSFCFGGSVFWFSVAFCSVLELVERQSTIEQERSSIQVTNVIEVFSFAKTVSQSDLVVSTRDSKVFSSSRWSPSADWAVRKEKENRKNLVFTVFRLAAIGCVCLSLCLRSKISLWRCSVCFASPLSKVRKEESVIFCIKFFFFV